MTAEEPYLTAKQAAEALGVTRATLYAYTSRGQLHSEPMPARPRERRYLRQDVERLCDRKESRRDPAKVAARGLHWGSPVLSSGVTLIHNSKLYYRGRDVLKLAETATLEEVARLLWEARGPEHDGLFQQRSVLSQSQLKRLRSTTQRAAAEPELLIRFQLALPLAGAADAACYDLRPSAVRQTGARILRLWAAIITGAESKAPLHAALQKAWAPGRPGIADVIRKALVLCADHELNASAFTARCAASAGAAPYDTVAAALATLKGSRHGGGTERAAALMTEAKAPGRARAVLANRLRRGERLPGFGHPLYAGGDPRAAFLMRLVEHSGNAAEWRFVRALSSAAFDLLHEHANVDFALVALARAYRLPANAPLILFAVSRTAGWIAHALEQYGSGQLIRPRASYTGPAPEDKE